MHLVIVCLCDREIVAGLVKVWTTTLNFWCLNPAVVCYNARSNYNVHVLATDFSITRHSLISLVLVPLF